MQTDKATRWAFTAYEAQWPLFEVMNDLIAEWGYQQEECSTTGRKHYQGWLRTKRQVRLAQLIKVLPGVHLEVAKNWSALQAYCRKEDTAVPGTAVAVSNPSQHMTMAQALDRLATKGDIPEPLTVWEAKPNRLSLIEKQLTEDYWCRVRELLYEDANLIGVYSQPQYLRAWLNTYPVWMDRQTDRQTDAGSLRSPADAEEA